MLSCKSGARAQIALEFLVVYSFVLVIFILLFGIVASQRAATLSQQEYANLQLQTQNIASYIDQALSSGSGYSASIPLTGNIGSVPYNLSVSTTGVVIAKMKIGTQILSSYAFSNSRSLIINGTLQQTANGISIYLVPTYKGALQLSNINGVIYVGQNPPSVASLARTLAATQVANAKVATISPWGAIADQVTSALEPSKVSVSVWFYEPAYPATNYPEVAGASFTQGYDLLLPFVSDHHADFIIGSGAECAIGAIPSIGQWDHLVGTYDGSNMVEYINGVRVASGVCGAISYTGVSGFVSRSFNNVGSQPFSVANIQIYKSPLTANQVNSLYIGGIEAAPIDPANIIGWWPLNGNMNDYSGNGNNGYPATAQGYSTSVSNVVYNTTVQLNVHENGATGNSITSGLVGYIASKGKLGVSNSYANYTGSTGNSTVILSTTNSSAIGTGNLTIEGFNGNTTLSSNLVAWWPLNLGYGNTIHDLSTHYHNGVFNSVASWIPATANLSNFAAARFPGDPGGGSQNSPTLDGWININQSASLQNIGRNGSFTAMAWIYYKNSNPVRCPGVIGDQPGYNTGQGFQLLATLRCGLLMVNSSLLGWPNGYSSFPTNTLEMVTAEYNGTSGQTAVYLNGTLFSSALLAKNLGVGQASAPFAIGDMAFDNSGINGFNGSIYNVQLYSTYLTQTQIGSLYRNGINSAPIGDSGLVGWWPLNGNANDYSSNGNNGVAKYNVTYANLQFAKSIPGSAINIANFTTNGGNWNYANVPYTSTLNPTSQVTMIAWVKTTMVQNGGWRYFVNTNGLANCDSGSYCLRWCCGSIYTHYYTASTGTFAFFSQGLLNNGAWHMIASTYNGSKVTLYLDGIVESTSPLSGTLRTVSSPVTLGYGYNGLMADVQIYNTSLTQYQVQQLYLQGLPIYKKVNVSLG